MALFINNLPVHVTHADILELFEEFGSVVHIFLPTDWYTNQSLGFAFVEMSTQNQAQSALQVLNTSQWMGHKLYLTNINTTEPVDNSVL